MPTEEPAPLESAFPIELLFACGVSSAGKKLTLNQDGPFVGQHLNHDNDTGDGYPSPSG